MQPEVQTTTRGSLAVSVGVLEIANVIQGALEVFWFTFTFNEICTEKHLNQNCLLKFSTILDILNICNSRNHADLEMCFTWYTDKNWLTAD